MTSFSTLCNSCNRALRSAIEPLWRSHHNTLQEYKEAVSQMCFICTVLWNSLSEEHRTAWAQDSAFWQPMKYSLYQPEGEETIVGLEIMFRNAEKNSTGYIEFRLVPPEGMFFNLLVHRVSPYSRTNILLGLDAQFRNAIPFHHLESTTSSSSALNLIREWCHSCHTSRSRCSRLVAEKPSYPTRLIDIGGQGDTEWRLHIPSEDEVLSTPYITLSYRWGSSAGLMLSRSKIDEFRCGRLIQDLPQTFKDLIDVAR